MEIVNADIAYIPTIQRIADKTWEITYRPIISKSQIDYMLDMMYSTSSLKQQMLLLKHQFVLIKEKSSNEFQGFVSFEHDYKKTNSTKLHKLYVLPNCQGKGLGKQLINIVCERSKEYGNQSVLLNMNRDNKAIDFYKSMGFNIIAEEDIDIGNGYLMEDFVFEKQL